MAKDKDKLNRDAAALEREARIRRQMAADGGEPSGKLQRQAKSMDRQAKGYRRKAR